MERLIVILTAAVFAAAACTTSSSVESVEVEPAPTVPQFEPSFEPSVAPQPRIAPDCDPNYAGGCVPVVSYDLNCPDIGFDVEVIGVDIHEFDRDLDGFGCETYG